MQIQPAVLGERLCQCEGVQLDVRISMSEPLENRSDDVTSAENPHVSHTRQSGCDEFITPSPLHLGPCRTS